MLPGDCWIDLNGARLHYLDWGHPSAQPLVLLHGFCSYAHYWDPFAQSMRRDYHVIVPDLRGHGDSDRAAGYSIEDGAADLEELAQKLKLENIVLVGLSMGGLISMYYTATYPNRITRLVIVDIGPEFAPAGIAHIQRDLANEPESFNTEGEAFQHLKKVQPFHSDAFLRHQVRHALKRDEDSRLRFKYDKSLCQIDLQSPLWLWDYLAKIPCPTLVVRATDSDMLTPEIAQQMVSRLPQGSLAEVARATHNIVGDNPEGFAAAVRKFLATGS